ncbi:hypothetical protein [Catellatospora tritici]|uniref:hypothetical protein n=1 Tax=Catellatospora tritici TaxID=2851566 RepID=UPI001C2DD9BC|nr:hypothetical protein [Catellatospora tritici]MBV1854602.1 hypothetical protein [Catellatospora tritici]
MDSATLAINIGMDGITAIAATSGRRTPLRFGDSNVLPAQVWQPHEQPISATPVNGATVIDVPDLLSTAPPDQSPRAVEAMSALLAQVAAHVPDVTTVGRLILALPDQWGPRRRALIRQAAEHAGLPTPVLVNTAEATATHATSTAPIEVGSSLLVCDLGNHASSITLLAREATGWRNLASIPAQATGAHLDENVLARLDFDDSLREQLTATTTANSSQARGQILAAIRTATATGAITRAAILLPEPYPPTVVTGAQLDAAAQPIRETTTAAARQAIEAADIDIDTIAGAIVTGPAATRLNVADHLARQLGITPLPTPSPELAAANGALTMHTSQNPPDTLGLLKAKHVGMRHLGAVATPMILGSILLLQIVTDARRLLPTTNYTGTYHLDELNAYLSINAYALTALCAALGLIAAGRIGAAVWTRHDHDNDTPGRHSTQAGRTLAAAAALGLAIAAMFGLLGETLFGTTDSTSGMFLRATILAALAPTVLAAAIGLLAPYSSRIRDAWADHLHYPATPVILAVAGTAATQAAAAGLPWLTAIDYAYIEAFGGRIGTGLLGVAIALTLAQTRLTRIGLAAVLGIGGVLVYGITNARLFTFAYLVAVALWWGAKAVRLIIAAVPRAAA